MLQFHKSSDTFPLKLNFTEAILRWGKELSSRGWISPGHGSLSYRYGLGFVVTPSDYDPAQSNELDMVLVERWDLSQSTLTIRGKKEPSGDSLWHALVYQNRSAAIFSFFARGSLLIESAAKQGLPSLDVSENPSRWTKEMEAGLGKGNALFIRGKGILSFGCTADDAGQVLLSLA